MKKEDSSVIPETSPSTVERELHPVSSPSRRKFMGTMGGVAAAAAVTAGIPLEPLFEGKHAQAEASVVPFGSSGRTYASWAYRDSTADAEKIDVGVLPDNGDQKRFTDFSGSWAKCL